MPKLFFHITLSLLSILFFCFANFSSASATQSYKVMGGENKTINEWAVCQKVTNAAGWSPVFVPTNTAFEWTAFRNYRPNHITLEDCGCGFYTVIGADGLTYGTVLGADGRCWLDRNLGATQVATGYVSDITSYGGYYQWGRSRDGHQVFRGQGVDVTSVNSSTDTPNHALFIMENYSPYDWRVPQSPNAATLWAGANGGSNNPCPAGWRIPTRSEWETIAAYFSPYGDYAINSSLKLPLAGFREVDDDLYYRGMAGGCWSSTPSSNGAYAFYYHPAINEGSNGLYPSVNLRRARAFSVRCIKN